MIKEESQEVESEAPYSFDSPRSDEKVSCTSEDSLIATTAPPARCDEAASCFAHRLWMMCALLLLEHPLGWHPKTHFRECDQSCGCCRSHNIEDGRNCEACYTGWVLSCVSRSALVCLRLYISRSYTRRLQTTPDMSETIETQPTHQPLAPDVVGNFWPCMRDSF